MSEQGDEQNKTEEPTPFKLQKARKKGQVARGMDLGFAAGLIALAAAATFAGEAMFVRMATVMKSSFVSGINGHGDSLEALALVGSLYWVVFQPLIVFGCIVALTLITIELLQLRGLIFSSHPLKPDLKRLNPAKGLKRLFSLRTLKETAKNLLKFTVYSTVAWLLGSATIMISGIQLSNAGALALTMQDAGLRLLYAFIGFALIFAALDQIIVRSEFHKQMRMSRRELTRETKDREGEPRLKQKRKDLHRDMQNQTQDLTNVPGSDMVIVNPDHFAVVLLYKPDTDAAPRVRAKGRNLLAQLLKRKARLHGVPIVSNPPLARALFAECKSGQEIAPAHYRDVARHYRLLKTETPPNTHNSLGHAA